MLAIELPKLLQQEFEQTARQFYDHDGVKHAAIEAIKLWLSAQRKRRFDVEAKANNQAFEKLRTQLETDYFGQWIVIADGQLQGVGDSLASVNHLVPDAQHSYSANSVQLKKILIQTLWRVNRS